jgi:hypothetical protein
MANLNDGTAFMQMVRLGNLGVWHAARLAAVALAHDPYG